MGGLVLVGVGVPVPPVGPLGLGLGDRTADRAARRPHAAHRPRPRCVRRPPGIRFARSDSGPTDRFRVSTERVQLGDQRESARRAAAGCAPGSRRARRAGRGCRRRRPASPRSRPRRAAGRAARRSASSRSSTPPWRVIRSSAPSAASSRSSGPSSATSRSSGPPSSSSRSTAPPGPSSSRNSGPSAASSRSTGAAGREGPAERDGSGRAAAVTVLTRCIGPLGVGQRAGEPLDEAALADQQHQPVGVPVGRRTGPVRRPRAGRAPASCRRRHGEPDRQRDQVEERHAPSVAVSPAGRASGHGRLRASSPWRAATAARRSSPSSAGERTVVRIYGQRSAGAGPEAPRGRRRRAAAGAGAAAGARGAGGPARRPGAPARRGCWSRRSCRGAARPAAARARRGRPARRSGARSARCSARLAQMPMPRPGCSSTATCGSSRCPARRTCRAWWRATGGGSALADWPRARTYDGPAGGRRPTPRGCSTGSTGPAWCTAT